MANAASPNLVLWNNSEEFHAIWKLTRVMLAAGWKYMAGANGQSSGCMNASQTGSAATILAFASNIQTFTGMANLTAGCVGQYITISNANTSGNNGTFLVLSFVSSSSITVYNTTGSSTDTHNGALVWALVRNPATDLWAVGGAVNLKNVSGGGSSSGSAVVGVASASTGQATLTGVTGFSQNLSPGRYVTIAGSTVLTTSGYTTYSNNGSFRIISVNTAGTSVVVYAPQLIAETGNSALTFTEQYGGNDGSVGAFSTTSTGTSTLINFTTSSFTGFTASDVGRRITILNAASLGNNNTFTIATYVSSSNVLLYNPGGVASDANNPNLQWVETDPLQHTYPSYLVAAGGQGAWINLQGPTVMKVPIGTNSATGIFIRGENITQTATGAQGELLGIITDTTGGTGYLVVSPRVVGSGSSGFSGNLYGWNNSSTDIITGGLSGATVTSTSGPPIAYIREMLFWKDTATLGHAYYQAIDQNSSTESSTTATTGRFSTMANTLSQVTSQVCPGGSTGGSPVSNGFPTVGTLTFWGTGGSGAAVTGNAEWVGGSTMAAPGRAHLLAANCIEQQGISQDGSWVYAQSGSAIGYMATSFQRMDNQEDGDLDPYTCQSALEYSQNNASRTVAVTGFGGQTDYMNTTGLIFNNTTYNGNWRGFRRRGLSGESFYAFAPALLADVGVGSPILTYNPGNPDQVATAVTTTYVREPLWLYLGSSVTPVNPRMRKGTCRWMGFSEGLSANQTTDNLKWVSLSSTNAMVVIGPWDGVTTPTF